MEQNWLDAFFLLFLMLLNAFAFIPQATKIYRTKSTQGVSPYTYLIFLIIQGYVVFHSFYYTHDYILAFGYLLSMVTCFSVLVLYWLSRKNCKIFALPTEISEVFSQFPGHLYIKDTEGKTLWCNYNNWKNFGYSSLESFVGKNDFSLFSKEDAEKLWATDRKVMESGLAVVTEEYYSEKGKECLYLSLKSPLKNSQGKVIGLIGTSVDITNAKKETSEKLIVLENVIAAMPGNVYWMNRDGIYLGCNDNQSRALGLTARQEIIGKRTIDFQSHAFPNIVDITNQTIMEKGVAVTLEEPAKSSDNSIATFTSSKVPLRDASGNVIGLLGISIDITEKKKAEQELREAKEKAEAANRAKTEFLANMSHDVKTPLSGVIGIADLMKQDLSGKDKKHADDIYACGMQLLAFFNSCLDLSKLELREWASEEEVFSLHTLLNDMQDLFSPSAETKGLQLKISCDTDVPTALLGYRASIYRVILNLIGNALKFTPKGSVQVRGFLSSKISEREILIGLEVKDTGIGIPLDQQQIIFEKLRRLTPSYEGKVEGSGIGLYVVDQYVKRMKGSIKVDSEVGKGSTFTVLLPIKISGESVVQEEKEILPNNQQEKISGKILLVEDNPLIQHVTQSLLTNAGFTVDVAGTGSEAIELFAPEKYNLIYMDIGLPDQDGYTVTQTIRAKEQAANAITTPIIALTAHGAVDIETFCGRAGMQGVISKPLTQEQAKDVWARYGLGKTDVATGLMVVGPVAALPASRQIIDMAGTITLLGSKEHAEELLALWFEMLTKRFLPALQDLKNQNDLDGLRHELHAMLGSLCYVKTPALNQAVLELQTAVRDHPQGIDSAYEHVTQEAERFVAQYQQQFL